MTVDRLANNIGQIKEMVNERFPCEAIYLGWGRSMNGMTPL